jgi:hypothetical protein|tara:strand:- start:51 stop:1376 length:1326 start_codon:yes stop_codon:yes gene_type:complete
MTNYKDAKYQIPASGIISGTLADARISESSVTAHVDLTPVRQDVLILALKQAVEENHTKYNLPNSSICKFEADADFNLAGSTTIGRDANEYISTSVFVAGGIDAYTVFCVQGEESGSSMVDTSASPHTITQGGGWTRGSTNPKFGTYYWAANGSTSAMFSVPHHADFNFYGTTVGGDDFTWEWWERGSSSQIALWTGRRIVSRTTGGTANHYEYVMRPHGDLYAPSITSGLGGDVNWFTADTWHHVAWDNYNQVCRYFVDGVLKDTGTTATGSPIPVTTTTYFAGDYGDGGGTSQQPPMDMCEMRFSKGISRYQGAAFTPQTSSWAADSTTFNAAGTALGTTNVPTSAVTDVSGVMLLKNEAGTATFGSGNDIIVSYTCDNSNWTAVTDYTDAGTFSTGIKMIKLGKKTCTSGSDVRWKIEFANQVDGSKETQIYGIGLNY